MKTIKSLILLSLVIITFNACSSDDDGGNNILQVEVDTVTNLFAPQTGGQGQPVSGDFTKFNFSTGTVTTSATEWDIAFRGTSIIVNGGASLGTQDEPDRNGNGGAYIATGTMADVTSANPNLVVQDSDQGYAIPVGSGNGWYNYNPMMNTIEPIPGRIIVVRTRDGKYAKLEILSYYKDAPEEITAEIAANDLRYYTFNFVYQPNEGETSFE